MAAGRAERSGSVDSLVLSDDSRDGSDTVTPAISQPTTPRRQRQLLQQQQQQQQMRAEEDAWLIPESVVIDPADGTSFQQQVRQLLARHEKVKMRRALSQFRETGYHLYASL